MYSSVFLVYKMGLMIYTSWDFPGGSVVKTLELPLQGASWGAGKKDEGSHPSYLYAT